ncbi:MAG TPA: ABC transporter permease [Actinomycetota bacterium]|nr:ABC transporter permease [Actinomycetota bacterium]
MAEQSASAVTAVREPLAPRPGIFKRMFGRPEFGSVMGAIIVAVFFTWRADAFFTTRGIANVLDPSASLGIMAVAVALLMVGGEFDLSAGVMIGATGTTFAMLTVEAGLNVWLAMLITLIFAVLIGLFNGFMVLRTRLPSFIVTLGTLFMLLGANVGVTRLVTNRVIVSGVGNVPGADLPFTIFASSPIGRFRVTVIWWLVITALATWVLLRTRFGNWIFGVGGDALAARSVGVPVAFTKIALFVYVSVSAWLVGMMNTFRLSSASVSTGIGQEFEFIIAAVIGGCLLTGGYGSAIGAAIGALIFGMVRQGIVLSGWNSDWFFLFLGVMLLIAALINQVVRSKAEEAR